MRIGAYTLRNNVVLAPMAGVTDRPFRLLCRKLEAGLTVSEMLTADTRLWHSAKSRLRMDHTGEPEPRSVQIAGADPAMMADAARSAVAQGAQIVDINMGCPAKKVCNRLAGSALLRDEPLVARILEAVVRAVEVPVTLKIRTGWDREQKNGVRIARLAEEAGIQAIAVHGRTRADGFGGAAEYDTIRAIKQSVRIPVIANGDITGPEKAREVLRATGADAVMIGRAAQGRPWIFREIVHFLATGSHLPAPDEREVCDTLLAHLENLYSLYGEYMGVRVARKHIGWYCKARSGAEEFRAQIMQAETSREQTFLIRNFFDRLAYREVRAA
ncbi:MAG TPA: tRNA dihydrouridine synthase DusB [Gammaproteobacteria bacterium]|nr:tRNA dihydrouridine synthase DusB [Gammaproteobacteria bacterium]